MVKRYLKGGVMENGVETETEEGSLQGGNLSPLLANVYLNELTGSFTDGAYRVFAMQMISYCWRRVNKHERLLESSTKYLEETLKLKSEPGKEQDSHVRNPKI